MVENRLKCSDVFKTVFLGKAKGKSDNGGTLQFEGKSVKFDWKEIKDNLYHRHGPTKSPTNFVDNKERRKTTGYCEYCRKRYVSGINCVWRVLILNVWTALVVFL